MDPPALGRRLDCLGGSSQQLGKAQLMMQLVLVGLLLACTPFLAAAQPCKSTLLASSLEVAEGDPEANGFFVYVKKPYWDGDEDNPEVAYNYFSAAAAHTGETGLLLNTSVASSETFDVLFVVGARLGRRARAAGGWRSRREGGGRGAVGQSSKLHCVSVCGCGCGGRGGRACRGA